MSESTGERLATASNQLLGARILAAHGLRKGIDILEQELRGSVDRREAVTASLWQVGTAWAYETLRKVFDTDSSIGVRLCASKSLGARLPEANRTLLISEAMRHESPLVRYEAVPELRLIGSVTRKAVVKAWMTSEPDPAIRQQIRALLRSSDHQG